MKVNWQSNAPSLELTVPVGSYLPYELPIATKEELGGVKIDGDTITITEDGVISSKQVDLSGVATQEELDQVKESIPDTSSFATKTEVEEVAAKIPDVEGFATQTELAVVKASIPDTSGLATKAELTTVENKIPSSDTFATKLEVATVEAKIPDVSNFATRKELTAVSDSIPNTSNLATKSEVAEVESKIPDTSGFAKKIDIPNVDNLATKVELSNVEAKIPNTDDLATKIELTEVENKIPSISNLATKAELSGVEAKIPSIDGLATKVEVQEVENKIPDVSNYATKTEVAAVEDAIPDVSNFIIRTELNTAISDVEQKIPSVSNLATKDELKDSITDVKSLIPSISNLATKTELATVENKIPSKVSELTNDSGYLTSHQDISNLATKAALDEAAAKIPTEYLKTANIVDNKLSITDASGTSLEFQGSSDSDFVINYINGEVDKTYNEILDAWNNKKNIKLAYEDVAIVPLLGYSFIAENTFTFATEIVMSENEDKTDPVFEGIQINIAADGIVTEDVYHFITQEFVKKDELGSYISTASVSNNALTLTTDSNTNIEYNPFFVINASAKFIYSIAAVGSNFTADKTYDEIVAALDNGKNLQLILTDSGGHDIVSIITNFYRISDDYGNYIEFTGQLHSSVTVYNPSQYNCYDIQLRVSNDNTWTILGGSLYRQVKSDLQLWVANAYATKANLSNIEAKIPIGYLQSVNVTDNTLTITDNSGDITTFTPNEVDLSNYATKTDLSNAQATIPTKTSELTNDSGYLTTHQDISNLATKTEVETAITNKGYQTADEVNTLINNALSNLNGNEVAY